MMRAPYTGEADSQVYTDSATNKADVSAAIPWDAGDMPSQFAFVHYRLKADENCRADCLATCNAPADDTAPADDAATADDAAPADGGRSTDAAVDCDKTCNNSCKQLNNALDWLQS